MDDVVVDEAKSGLTHCSLSLLLLDVVSLGVVVVVVATLRFINCCY